MLSELPTMAKADVIDVPIGDRRAGPPINVRPMRTSGSTGHPIHVEYSEAAARLQAVMDVRMRRHQGNRLLARSATMVNVPDPRTPNALARRVGRPGVWLSHTAGGDELSRLLADSRPERIRGTPSGLIRAGECLRSPLRPAAVVTSSEQLTTEQRRLLMELYGVEPRDIFGSAEAGDVAWQCSAVDLYHVNHDGVVVELLDDDGHAVAPGQWGEITVTTLWNPHMPSIRYRQGDRARWAERQCRCGSQLPCLAEVGGRVLDEFIDAEGGAVLPTQLWLGQHLPPGMPLTVARRYQITQQLDGRVTVEIEPRHPLSASDLEHATRSYQTLLRGGEVEVRTVTEIPVDRDAKFSVIRRQRA
jgi:phenylacetate-coenzyme A ligase PaaK-like adenylate-forming protein